MAKKDHWGRGIAKEAIRLVIDYSFNYLSLRIDKWCASTNIPMIKVFEKLGFSKEACLKNNLLISGKFDDHILFGLFKENII